MSECARIRHKGGQCWQAGQDWDGPNRNQERGWDGKRVGMMHAD